MSCATMQKTTHLQPSVLQGYLPRRNQTAPLSRPALRERCLFRNIQRLAFFLNGGKPSNFYLFRQSPSHFYSGSLNYSPAFQTKHFESQGIHPLSASVLGQPDEWHALKIWWFQGMWDGLGLLPTECFETQETQNDIWFGSNFFTV